MRACCFEERGPRVLRLLTSLPVGVGPRCACQGTGAGALQLACRGVLLGELRCKGHGSGAPVAGVGGQTRTLRKIATPLVRHDHAAVQTCSVHRPLALGPQRNSGFLKQRGGRPPPRVVAHAFGLILKSKLKFKRQDKHGGSWGGAPPRAATDARLLILWRGLDLSAALCRVLNFGPS